MRLLVTGGTGFLGNNLVRQLCVRGDSVRVLVRNPHSPTNVAALANLQVEVCEGDVVDSDAVDRASRDMQGVIHAAANVHIGWTQTDPQLACNVEGTRNIASAALKYGAKLVHVSTINALALPLNGTPAHEETQRNGSNHMPDIGYVRSKVAAEEVILEQVERGLHATIVNPGFMFGPWDWKPTSGRMLLEVGQRFVPFAPSGGCSVCDVRDVASGILAALDCGQPGRRYILGGENLSYFDLWSIIAKVANKRRPWMRADPRMRWIAGTYGNLRAKFSGRESDINSAAIAMSSVSHFYRSDRAHHELGYHSRPIEESLRDAWSWFQEHGYRK